MPASALTATGYLLQEVRLANDDSLLIFFTAEFGKIKVFASKLQRSKKKRAEIDYFRRLELGLWKPKEHFKLKSVCALQDYAPRLEPYARVAASFEGLKQVNHFCPEETVLTEIEQLMEEWWHLNHWDLALAEVYFYTKLLWHSGILPRFDDVRSAVWVDPIRLEFFTTGNESRFELTNKQRQMLEWVRRGSATEISVKCDDFEVEDWQVLRSLLQEIIKNH